MLKICLQSSCDQPMSHSYGKSQEPWTFKQSEQPEDIWALQVIFKISDTTKEPWGHIEVPKYTVRMLRAQIQPCTHTGRALLEQWSTLYLSSFFLLWIMKRIFQVLATACPSPCTHSWIVSVNIGKPKPALRHSSKVIVCGTSIPYRCWFKS